MHEVGNPVSANPPLDILGTHEPPGREDFLWEAQLVQWQSAIEFRKPNCGGSVRRQNVLGDRLRTIKSRSKDNRAHYR